MPLENWLYLLIVNETISFVCSIADSYSKMKLLYSEHPDLSQNESYDSTFFNPDYIFSERSNQICSNYIVIKEINKMSPFFYFLLLFNAFFRFYIFLFMWGNMLLFFTESNCGQGLKFVIYRIFLKIISQVSPNLTLLVLVFTLFGYIYLFYPILMLISITLCLPFLLIFGIFFDTSENKPAENVFFLNFLFNFCNFVII